MEGRLEKKSERGGLLLKRPERREGKRKFWKQTMRQKETSAENNDIFRKISQPRGGTARETAGGGERKKQITMKKVLNFT